MGSNPGRVVNSWKFPEGSFMRCVAKAIWDTGCHGKNSFPARFYAIIPHWKSYFKNPIEDNAPLQRADKSARYASENPVGHKLMGPYWEIAKQIVAEKRKLSAQDVAEIVGRPQTTVSAPEVEIPNFKHETGEGYLYVLGSPKTPDKCGIGISKNPGQRVQSFAKGSLDNSLLTHALFRCEKAAEVESWLKTNCKGFALGHERFDIDPEHMACFVVKAAQRINSMIVKVETA